MENNKKKLHALKKSMLQQWEIYPLLFLVCLYPLIMRLEFVPIDLSQYSWFPDTSTQVDVFLFWKSRVLVVLASIMLFFIMSHRLANRKSKRLPNYFMFLLGYIVLVIISTICSNYRSYSIFGGIEQYESVWVLIGYVIIAVTTYYFMGSNVRQQVFLVALCIGAGILVIIGLSQLFDSDLMKTDILKYLYIPNDLVQYWNKLNFNFSGGSSDSVYMTLYNPNYVGSYVVLVLPVIIGVFTGVRKAYVKRMLGGLIVGLVLCLYGSGSKAAAIVLFLIGVFTIYLIYEKRKMIKIMLCGLIAMVLCSGILLFYMIRTDTSVLNKLEAIHTTTDAVVIQYNKESIKVRYEENELKFYKDKQSECMITEKRDGVIRLVDPLYENIYGVFGQNKEYFTLIINGKKWSFAIPTYTFINDYGKEDQLVDSKSVLDQKLDELFSSRGYIWGRIIPTINKYAFIGSGPDTFLMEFSQSDYVAKWKAGYGSELITKPHSMYLQMAVQTGILSVVCFLGFCYSYVRRVIKGYKGHIVWTWNHRIEFGIFLGVVGYLIIGIVNDSTNTIAPIFWCFIGFGWNMRDRIEKDS